MQMGLFTVATITPAGLILLGALWGGAWAWAALLYITLFAAGMDRFVPRLLPEAPEGAEFPSGKRLSVGLGAVHFLLLFSILPVLFNVDNPSFDKLLSLLAAGLWLGQVSHPNAHELIHRPERLARMLGRAVYGSVMMGHHASAHLLVHHVHVGTAADPNSAPRGMGFYRFFASAWARSFRAGLRAENALRTRSGKGGLHPYLGHVGLAAAGMALSGYAFGLKGLATYLFLCVYAQAQILLADYVQHYGLRRALKENGKPVPVDDGHSWNSPHWFSSAMMVNAPRHSDHHLHPSRPYPGLRLRETMPILPHSLPVMAVIALIPPLWRKVMARELGRL